MNDDTAANDAYLAALRILNYRFNSEAELRRKLARKQFESAVIDDTIERLRSEKWLDDERFAGALVRTRANKRHGKLRILRELQAAGVEGDTARSAVEQNLDEDAQLAALRELATKRARLLARRHGQEFLASAEGRNKLTGYLLKQGYDAALIRSLIGDVVKEILVAQYQ
ncbi:MAG TPA: regulatory protein RecX [Thermoanaerobaculia bacterium]|nr:regulatory protein RecX [Thermoanaerobaculia bacterium]